MQRTNFEPLETETISDYLKRLRVLAGEILGRTVTQDQVAEMSQACFSAPQQQLTGSWLSKAEAGRYNEIGGDKLRSLAVVYSRLLNTPIPADWLLAKAGFDLIEPNVLQVEHEIFEPFLSNGDILALVGICGQLAEMGHNEDVRLIARFAHRLLTARDPKADPGNLFKDPRLSAHVRQYIERLEL